MDVSSLYHTDSFEHLKWASQTLQNIKQNNGYDLTDDISGPFMDLELLFYEESPDHLKWKANLYASMGLNTYNDGHNDYGDDGDDHGHGHDGHASFSRNN